jgi:nitrogen regulatory protein PII
MKLITATVKPGRLDDVMRAATDAGARGLTATEVRGFGQHRGGPNRANRAHVLAAGTGGAAQ